MTNIIKRETANRQPATLGNVMDQVFHNSLNKFFKDDYWGFDGSLTRNQAPVNILETEKNFELQMIAPGFKKNDFQLKLSDDLLTITVQRKEENTEEDRKSGWLRQEYRMQSFTRSFNLDDTVDASKISAKYEDGILHLVLPKKEGAQRLSRTINVE